MKKYLFFTLVVLFISANLFAQGAGGAIDCGTNNAFVGYCAADFEFTSQISVTAWIKWNIVPSTYGVDGKWANIASNNAYNSGDVGQFWLQHNSDNSHFEFAVRGSTRSFVTSTTFPQQNVWYHVAGVYDALLLSNRMKIYVNGVFEAGNNSVSGNVTTLLSSFLFKVGRWSAATGVRSFDGVIDEVSVWKKALSEDEIRGIMCEKLTGSETDLAGYWRFDEGALDTTADLSGNGNSGYVFMEIGQAESGTGYTITDLGKTWTVNEWVGHLIGITNGTGAGQKRRIVSNTSTTLTVVNAWDTNPDATSIYVVSSYNEWVTSGAALGDTSTYDYLSPTSVNLASSYGDDITVGTITGSPAGVQIYRIDSAPNVTTPPSGFYQLSQSHYFGVLIAGGTSPDYTITYNYDGHLGISDESTLKLAKRNNNADGSWEDAGATLDQDANTLTKTGQTGTEYILGSTGEDSLPVELSSFSASVVGSAVKLNWGTETEINNYGFDVERCALSAERQAWETIGFVSGNGNSNSPKNYSYVDDNVNAGTYCYRLKQIDNDGQFEYSKAIEIGLTAPDKFELSQNYPNPFNPSTTINYNLPEAANVKLIIYNILGQEVKTLVNEFKEAGVHTVNFNASELNSGLYIYKIEAGSFTQTRKMTLIK